MQNEDLKHRLSEVIERYKSDGLYTECFASTGRLHEPQAIHQYGNQSIIFDLSSVTKAVCTAPLVFESIQQDKLTLAASLVEWYPKLQDYFGSAFARISNLKVSELLSHTSGLPFWTNFYVCRLNQNILASELLAEPARSQHIATTFGHLRKGHTPGQDVYSDLGYILLGAILEKKTRKKIDELYSEFLNKNLKITATNIGFQTQLTSVAKKNFASTGYCSVRGRELVGEVHDENCAALGGVAGHSGLFSNGKDLSAILKALYTSKIGNQYILENAKYLKFGNPTLMGMRQGNDAASEVFAGGLAMGHWGFTGTGFWLCPKSNRYAIFLTNRIVSGRIDPRIKQCRVEVFKILEAISS